MPASWESVGMMEQSCRRKVRTVRKGVCFHWWYSLLQVGCLYPSDFMKKHEKTTSGHRTQESKKSWTMNLVMYFLLNMRGFKIQNPQIYYNCFRSDDHPSPSGRKNCRQTCLMEVHFKQPKAPHVVCLWNGPDIPLVGFDATIWDDVSQDEPLFKTTCSWTNKNAIFRWNSARYGAWYFPCTVPPKKPTSFPWDPNMPSQLIGEKPASHVTEMSIKVIQQKPCSCVIT